MHILGSACRGVISSALKWKEKKQTLRQVSSAGHRDRGLRLINANKKSRKQVKQKEKLKLAMERRKNILKKRANVKET